MRNTNRVVDDKGRPIVAVVMVVEELPELCVIQTKDLMAIIYKTELGVKSWRRYPSTLNSYLAILIFLPTARKKFQPGIGCRA